MVVQTTNHPKHIQFQRIYIGGIDSSRGLAVSEVWQRLEAKLANPGDGVPKLQWSDLYCGSCCLQVTVTSDHIDQSPLKIVKSSFHNVMWKGCKLVVDEARPHFLQRLQDERNIRQSKESLEISDMESGRPQTAASLTEPQHLARYWKVRRGYCGEPVRHVDTQSCDVTSWSMFDRIRQRHKKQQEKDRLRRIELLKSGTNMTVKEAQKRAYYNRSIRLKFTDELDINTSSCLVDNELIADDVTSTDQSIDNSDDDNTSKSIEASSTVQKESGKYVWSDDDSSIDENDELKAQPVSNVDDIESNAIMSSLQEGVVNRSTYIWSDDENSSDSGTINDLTKRQYNNPYDLDEFESALDLATDEGMNEKETSAIDDKNYANEYDLTMDVKRNLAILSQLFPETSKVHQKLERVIDEHEKKPPFSAPHAASGWGASGQMLRFDPSRPQSTSFLLNDDISNIDCNTESTIDNTNPTSSNNIPDQSSDNENELTIQNTTNEASEVTATKGVYEQKKLEQVFKDAREGIPIISSDRSDGGTSFAFGFEVEGDEIQNEASSSTFTFNFGIHETTGSHISFDAENLNETGGDGSTTHNVESSAGNRPRFRAFEFPNEDILNEMVHNFYYKINDGERIIRNVDEWRNDPSVKEKWLKDRLALTQDWKRKRKFALSKKQKRSKKV